MIASEFGRAATRSEYRDNVLACYARARELMGILETITLPQPVIFRLRPLFQRAAEQELLQEHRLTDRFIKRSCAEYADEFNQAAAKLKGM